MPDEELLKLAAEGKLREKLDAQIDRMLASPRADQLDSQLRRAVARNPQARDDASGTPSDSPNSTTTSRSAFREETYQLLAGRRFATIGR